MEYKIPKNKIVMLSKYKYKKFLSFHRNMYRVVNRKIGGFYNVKLMDKIQTSELTEGEIIEPVYHELMLIDNKIELSYESLPFLFSLDGHDKNLLLFFFAYCVENDCTFIWNRIVADHYADANEAVTGKKTSYGVIRQSVYSLIENNAIKKIEAGKYMLNPLLYPISKNNQYHKKELIKTYGNLKKANNCKGTIDSLFCEEKSVGNMFSRSAE